MKQAIEYVKNQIGQKPDVAVVLGSGLGSFGDQLLDKVIIPYEDIPGYPQTTVVGHSGQLSFGTIGGKIVLSAQGRFHYYEGHDMETIVKPIKLFNGLSVSHLIITNSAGSLIDAYPPGTIMGLNGHMDCTYRANEIDPIIVNDSKYHDESFLNINDYIHLHEVCDKCSGELIPVESEGVMICKVCSHQINFIIEHEKPSYKEPPKEVCFYAYKRINHFREILAQFQAKETTQIPDEVLKNITLQIKKERITLAQMSNKKAKDILKKLGYNKYYEHIPFIKDKLGIKPPIMKPRLEETLCCLFMDIQKPYAKHCPDDRVNFLNYYYVLYKMCELLGENQFLSFFPILKDPVKRIEQDDIWKKICKELQWEFIPTI